jgi:hypothetical protein
MKYSDGKDYQEVKRYSTEGCHDTWSNQDAKWVDNHVAGCHCPPIFHKEVREQMKIERRLKCQKE